MNANKNVNLINRYSKIALRKTIAFSYESYGPIFCLYSKYLSQL